MTPLRVLRVITRLNVGGPARQITSLWRGLDPDEFTQLVLAGEDAEGEADYQSMAATDVEVVRVPGLRRLVDPLGEARALPALRRHIRNYQPDVIHTHLTKAGALGRVAALTTGRIPTVHTFHGHVLYGILSPGAVKAVTLLERALAPRTEVLVSVGRRVRDELLAAGIGRAEQFEVVPPGIDLPPSPEAPVARQLLGLPPDRPIVTMVGRLTRQKRPDRFVEVARTLEARHPSALFLLVGGGELEVEARRRAGGLTNVRFLGWRADIEVVLAASDIAVLSSDNEGMPVALIEAGLAGRPTVATDVGSTSEVVRHGTTGLVTSVSVEALADGISRLLDDPDLRSRMGEEARRVCERDFSAQRLVADMARIYRRARLGSAAGV